MSKEGDDFSKQKEKGNTSAVNTTQKTNDTTDGGMDLECEGDLCYPKFKTWDHSNDYFNVIYLW